MPRLSKIGAAALAAFGWTGISTVSASYLVVGGGASGGRSTSGIGSGGGGAGGYQTGTTSLNPTLSYTVTVGAGGASATAANATGLSGSSSQLGTLTASTGGGGGGTYNNNNAIGVAGASGGGGGGLGTGTGGAGTSGQGNNGGNGANSNTGGDGGGGGGGAGAVGGNGSGTVAGSGGVGLASSISGSSVFRAGGGGGAGITNGSGGNGGGSAGGWAVGSIPATANTGGGGGAGDNGGASGQGGSGIVIISYLGAQKFSGGVVTSVGGNTIHTFTTSGTLGPVTPLLANYLVVAGGGAGGYDQGGGGGAGGLLSGSALAIDSSSTYLVTVGAGATQTGNHATTANGSNSAFSMVSTAAVGGGGAAGYNTNGASGGSGGGGGGANTGTGGLGGAGTSGQGSAGGNAINGGYTSGGGGGASAVGGTSTLSAGGNGGAGSASSISGSSVTYAGGGGGGVYAPAAQTVGTGGAGGGGTGGGTTGTVAGTAGAANLGGGGGGGSGNGGAGGQGGSGVVIISYAGATQLMAGGVVTISGGNVIHTFNSTGFLTPLTLLTRSLRFRSSASAYLNRTQGAGNRRIFTLSTWVKRGSLGSYNPLFTGQNDSANSDWDALEFNSSDVLRFYLNGAASGYFVTTQVFRDPAAWYHLVLAVDTTQATSTNRVKIYVNGSQITNFTTETYPSQNFDCWINKAGRVAALGANYYSVPNAYFDGYMAEVNFIDGQALTPTSFGTFNSYGVWQPITYGGSYGTNGFRLPFTNNASTTTLGYDFSPQGNNWTTNNISVTAGSTYDSMTDVPTLTSATAANYAVLNPISNSTYTLSYANLNVTTSNGSSYIPSTIALPATGMFYFEYLCQNGAAANRRDAIGVVDLTSTRSYLSAMTNSVAYLSFNGAVSSAGSTVATYSTWDNGDIAMCAFDCSTGKVWFGKNGVFNGSPPAGTGNATTLTNVGNLAFAISCLSASPDTSYSSAGAANFGQRPFSYTPPSGFVALNTFNL